jgi:hypothetical protein
LGLKFYLKSSTVSNFKAAKRRNVIARRNAPGRKFIQSQALKDIILSRPSGALSLATILLFTRRGTTGYSIPPL